MKKTAVALAFLITSVTLVNAQNSNVVSAARHMEDYNKDHDTTDLFAAKGFIDQAITNEKTMNEAKTFFYRGMVYQAIYENQVNSTQAKILKANLKTPPRDAQNQAIAKADTAMLSIAVASYLKAIQLDPKSEYADNSKSGLKAVGVDVINKAIIDNNNGNYASSSILFGKVVEREKMDGVPDTSALYKQILQSAAVSSEKAKNFPKAIMYFKQMENIKGGSYSYKDVPYSELYKIYMDQNDTNDALAAVTLGRAAVPDNIDLLNDETNGFLWRNQSDKAEGNLKLAIDKLNKKGNLSATDKDLEARLYFILGSIYDNLANPRDSKNELVAKPADFTDLFQKADTNYKIAISLESDFYQPYVNIGALYLNRTQVIFNKINELTSKNQKANTKSLEDEAKAWLYKAEPYLEKAHAMKPDEHEIKMALLKLYANTGQDDKAKALSDQK